MSVLQDHFQSDLGPGRCFSWSRRENVLEMPEAILGQFTGMAGDVAQRADAPPSANQRSRLDGGNYGYLRHRRLAFSVLAGNQSQILG
jgi:hypothetical protein